MTDDETQFDKFWEASCLDRFNIQQFSQQLNSYDSDNKELFLQYPAAPMLLPVSKTQVNKISKKRKSERTFSKKNCLQKN